MTSHVSERLGYVDESNSARKLMDLLSAVSDMLLQTDKAVRVIGESSLSLKTSSIVDGSLAATYRYGKVLVVDVLRSYGRLSALRYSSSFTATLITKFGEARIIGPCPASAYPHLSLSRRSICGQNYPLFPVWCGVVCGNARPTILLP